MPVRKNGPVRLTPYAEHFRRLLGEPYPTRTPAPAPRYEPDVDALAEAMRTGCVSGVDPAHCLHRLAAAEAYAAAPRQRLGDLELVRASPTLKLYRRAGTSDYIAAVRGTHDAEDLIADAALSAGALRGTSRYAGDRALLADFLASTPAARIGYAGHSLGGAIARELAGEFGAQSRGGVTFNSAFDASQLGGPSRNFVNYFNSTDPLYHLAKPFVKDLRVVQADHLDPLEAHRVRSFLK